MMLVLRQSDELGFIILMMLLIILAVLIRNYVLQKKKQAKRIQDEALRSGAQPVQNNVFNISGRVQGGQQHVNHYPDAFLSVDHITITSELNKPPKYDDAPPPYEEAIKLATAHSNSIQTYQAEQQARSSPQAPSSSSASTVPPALNPTTA